jgi:hypothetical protein
MSGEPHRPAAKDHTLIPQQFSAIRLQALFGACLGPSISVMSPQQSAIGGCERFAFMLFPSANTRHPDLATTKTDANACYC